MWSSRPFLVFGHCSDLGASALVVAWTADGRPVEVTVHVMPVHQWHLEYEWEVPV